MGIKNLLKNTSWTVVILGAVAITVTLMLLCFLFFLKGAAYLSTTIGPILNRLSVPLFLLCLFVFLPMTFVKKTRSAGLVSLLFSSYAFGLLAWLMGFIATLYYLGVVWVFIGLFFLGVGVVPLGIFAGVTHHRADISWSLIALIVLTYGIRLFTHWYANYMDSTRTKSHRDKLNASKKLKILVVEDDRVLSETFCARLEGEGYATNAAFDGEDALSKVVTYKPDLILTGILMPKISGFELIDLIRSTPKTRHIKIVVISALSLASDKDRAMKLGADAYLAKGKSTMQEVIDQIEDVIGKP